jgi:acetyl-CoA synthetase
MNSHGVADFDELLSRADCDPDWFWRAILDNVRFQTPYEELRDESRGPEFTSWCVGGRTNIFLNCIERHRDTPVWTANAIVYESEQGSTVRWSYQRLAHEVDALANGLRAIGCQRGEVIGLYLSNLPEAIASFLAVGKIGAIVLPLFSGFGAAALASRVADAGATTVITVDGTRRRGRLAEMKAVVDEAAANLPQLMRVVVLRRAGIDVVRAPERDYDYDELLEIGSGESPTEYLDADAPLMLMYTSGTTGKPKGTVHTHVGFLAKMTLDMSLMLDLKPSDRLLWISDMGWLVGPMIAVGTTFIGASAVIVEGGPDYPDPGRMWRLIDEHQVTFLGMAPTIARSFMKAGGAGVESRDLSSLRIIASTGEAWTPDAWHWVFDHLCRRKIPILNYSGGTEVGGGILTGTVLHPMKPCAFTTAIPGMHADIVDETGKPVPEGTVGELVLRRASMGMSRSLWHDDQRYLESYWESLPGLWRQGDWALKDSDGFWYIRGRSDDTLKIAGKRTGPAEIEGLLAGTGKVAEAAAIGVPHPVKGQAVGCLVVLMPGTIWSDSLLKQLETAVVEGLGPPYRPSFIVPVPDLPKTRNMKIMRRMVRVACLGQDAGDTSSLINPEAVESIAVAMRNAGLTDSIGANQ